MKDFLLLRIKNSALRNLFPRVAKRGYKLKEHRFNINY